MTLESIIRFARWFLDDTNTQAPLWSDEELIHYANDAESEACRRSLLLRDSTTEEICEIDVAGGTSRYALDPRVLFVVRTKFDTLPLEKTQTARLDMTDPAWEERTGTPTHYIHEDSDLVLFPSPKDDGTLYLQVFRLPLEEMSDWADVPEIPTRYHMALAYWVCHMAYQKQDAEAENLNKANYFMQKFMEAFGPKPTASTEMQRRYLTAPASIQGRRLGD